MTDSMKFGPEWLRNLSTDPSTSAALGNNSNNGTTLGNSNSNVNVNVTVSATSGINNNYTSNNGTTATSSASARNMFPEFRYGREEMLSLFDKNCNIPELLPLFKKICVEKVQIPLALTPSTEDEIGQIPVSTQRPLWTQRSPLGFSSSTRGGLSRGGSAERGRIRGKPMYTTFQRAPAMFEEEVRPPKQERTWYERNGSGETSVGNSSSGNSVAGTASDWNGGGSPHTSPRREFSNHSRNMENWRRNRHDDGAGEPTTDGWRTSNSGFGGLQRWGRSASWRDEDEPQTPVSNSSNTVQRSFSTISTANSGNSIQKNSSGKAFNRTRNTPSPSTSSATSNSESLLNAAGVGPPNRNNQWAHENGSGTVRLQQDGEDNLPEWATDVPLDGGGSFDATGAFLGSSAEEGGDLKFGDLDKAESESNKFSAVNKCSAVKDKTTSPPEKTAIHKEAEQNFRQREAKEIEIHTKESSSGNDRNVRNNERTEDVKSSSSTTETVNPNEAIPPSKPEPIPPAQPGQRRLSDHMIEAADDMVKKLINDDDVSEVEKPGNVTAPFMVANTNNMVNINTMKTVSSLEQSLLSGQNMPNNNKGMFFYGGMNTAQLPQLPHHYHRPQNILHGSELSSMASVPSGTELWYYRDPQSKVQGPFAALEMTEWYRAGYFNENLLVRRACDIRFRALGDLIKTCQNNMPFTHSSLLANVNMEAAPSPAPPVQHQNISNIKEPCDELKGNVTAAADMLSEAVKNMSSVDMLHMLNVHFQMLQEQYIRRQEMAILSELAKNESFHRLSPAERESIVRQKAQINGLPEYLTSLTSLGNTLVTLNPSAGTQLFNAILECSKKDNQQHQQIFPQPNAMSSNYMDVGEFIMNMQRQQQPRHQSHQQPQQQQQHQQNQLPQQQIPRPPQMPAQFPGFEGSVNVGAAENLVMGNGMIEDLNLRLMLSGNNVHAPQPMLHHHAHAPKATSQEMITNSHSGGFLTEHQILASAAANATQSPLLQMWMPQSVSPNILGTPHSPQMPQMHTPQHVQHSQPPHHKSQNQWTTSGPLVGIQNVIAAEVSPVEQQLDVVPSATPTSMWMNMKLPQNKDLNNDDDANATQLDSCGEQSKANRFELMHDSVDVSPSIDVVQFQNEDENSPQSSSASSYAKSLQKNDEESSVQSIEKQLQQGLNKKQKQNVGVVPSVVPNQTNQKIKDDFKKVDSEEKRRQKEERKRQQIEEEKKRQQQVEQERRRQLQEEEDRQKQIQAQRRKALLGSGNANGNSNGSSSTTKIFKEQKQQSSVAPWSAQSVTTIAASSPCLAEIQKAERRERRADQQRQLELHEKQVRLNTAAALEATEATPKWNAAPVQAKSIAEIQAEEAKKLNAEALFEAQRRKELEQQSSTLNTTNVSSNSASNLAGPISTWNNVGQSSKFWGSSSSASNNNATGFWEEPTKQKAGTSGTFAAAISSGKQQNNAAQKAQLTSVAATTSTTTTTSRNLKKSQTVSVMQSTQAAAKTAKAVNMNNQNLSGGSSSAASKQAASSKSANPEKKGATIVKNNNGNSGKSTGSNKDEYENEFINWCMKSLSNMNTKVDVPTFVTFLRDLESPYEVKDYVRIYLGESKEFNDFAKQFLERRSKYKNLQRAQNAHNDDMCKPAPAITPSASNENSETKNKQKKVKKNKMTKLDARILGFSVTAAEGRINVGDRDYVDAP